MTLRRGFRTEANALAMAVRAEIGLRPTDALDPLCLAESLGIPVVRLTDMATDAQPAVHQLTRREPGAFSAVTVFCGYRRTIVHNDRQSPRRQRSNVTHELSHGLLLHPATPPFEASSLTNEEAEREEEASWLSGALLVTEYSALHVAREGLSNVEAAELYAVSEAMIAFRMNVTAARRRVSRRVPALTGTG